MCNGIYKVSLVEFIALPAKAVVNVMFSYVKKGVPEQAQLGTLVSAEGFFGIRKL